MSDPSPEPQDIHDDPQEPVTLTPSFAAGVERVGAWVDRHLNATQYKPTEAPLYHSTDLGGCRGIVASDEIWLTSIRQMNDPDELIFAYTIMRRVVKEMMARDPRHGLMLGGFLQSAAKIPSWFGAYTASFSRSPGDEKHWKEYGRDHQGACLVLSPQLFAPRTDSTHGLHPLEKVIVAEVRYGPKAAEHSLQGIIDEMVRAVPVSELRHVSTKDLTAFVAELHKKLAIILIQYSVTTKRKKWASEGEVRFIAVNDKRVISQYAKTRFRDGKKIEYVAPTFQQACCLSIRAPGSVQKIIVGARVTDAEIADLQSFLTAHGVAAPVERYKG